jgi:hypothetical protein
VINNDRLTLDDGGKMKFDINPFPVGMVELMDKNVLVHMQQAEITKGKNVVISDELRNRMIKPHNPEIGMWKENMPWNAWRIMPSLIRIGPYQALVYEG